MAWARFATASGAGKQEEPAPPATPASAWERFKATSKAADAEPEPPVVAAAVASAPGGSPEGSEDLSSDEDRGGEAVIWEAIGGGRNSGLQVRTGQSLSSPVASLRLSKGAVVRQRRLVGNRLRYELLSGDGPPTGWVTTTLGNKALLVRKDSQSRAEKAPEGSTDDDAQDAGTGAAASAAAEAGAAVAPQESQEGRPAACGCSACRRPLKWSNFALGDYAEGWDCENLEVCGNGSFNCGPFRWFCAGCQVDVCKVCAERRQEQRQPPAGAVEQAPPPRGSSQQQAAARAPPPRRGGSFAWDHPLSQAEGRTRSLASDTVAGSLRRLAELEDRNAALEAERGALLARVERLEGQLRRCSLTPAAAGVPGVPDTDRCHGSPEAAKGEAGIGEEAAQAGPVELRPMLEEQGGGSAVTCLCFGQERHYLDHVLLAAAYADGAAVLYRCDKTAEETTEEPLGARLPARPEALQGGDGGTGSLPSHPPSGRRANSASQPAARAFGGGGLLVLWRLSGHTRAISSMTFSPLEEQLLTASLDRSLRLWDVASGELRAVFTDACQVSAAAFLPLCPGTFVAAVLGVRSHDDRGGGARPLRHSSRRASLRLVSAQFSSVLHALPAASDVHALCLDSTGRFLLAGTERGGLLAMEASAPGDRLLPRLEAQLCDGRVTSILRAPSVGSTPKRRQRVLLAAEGPEESSVVVADCVYASAASGGHLLSVTAQRRVVVPGRPPRPLGLCCRQCGPGLLLSGLEDGGLFLCPLDQSPSRRSAALHDAPVAATAASSRGTLVASADAKGRVVIWQCRTRETDAEEAEAEEADAAPRDAKAAVAAVAGGTVPDATSPADGAAHALA